MLILSPIHLYLAPLLAVKCCAIHTSNKDKNEEIKSLTLSLSLKLVLFSSDNQIDSLLRG